MNKEEIIEILRKLSDYIRINYNAQIIGIFGSYSRGDQKEASDVDIRVRFGEGATLFDFVGLCRFLGRKT